MESRGAIGTPKRNGLGRQTKKGPLPRRRRTGKTVATALLLPPDGGKTPHGILRRSLEAAAERCAAYIESSVFPAELQRYEEVPGSAKRRSYLPLHIYLSFEITAAGSRAGEAGDIGTGLSSCLGEMLFYRGEQLTDYRVFSLTADEKAQIFLPPGELLKQISKKERRAAEKSVPFDRIYLREDTLIGCRIARERLPLRCRRRDVREKLLERQTLGRIRNYRSLSPDRPLEKKKKQREAKSRKAKKAKKKQKPLDKREFL